MKTKQIIVGVLFFLQLFVNCTPALAESSAFHYMSTDDAGSVRYKAKKKNQTQLTKTKNIVPKEPDVVELSELSSAKSSEQAPSNGNQGTETSENEIDAQPESTKNFGRLKFFVSAGYLTVEGVQSKNNTRGELNSKLFSSYDLSYIHTYRKWEFALHTQYRQVQFHQSEFHTVNRNIHKMYDADFSVSRRMSRFNVGVGLGQDNLIFYKSLNTSLFEVERRSLDQFFIFTNAHIYEGSTNDVFLGIKYGRTQGEHSETYEIKGGNFYRAHAGFSHNLSESTKIHLEGFLKNNDYKAQELILNSSEIGIAVGFSMDWGSLK